MDHTQILILWAIIAPSMLLWRVGPLIFLGKRELPESVSKGISYIPVAAFSALIANDLFQPDNLLERPALIAVELLAVTLSVVVAKRTKSLIWTALAGMLSFALISYLLP